MNEIFVHNLIRRLREERTVTLGRVCRELRCSYADAFDGIRELAEIGLLEYEGDGKFRVRFDEDKARAFKRNHGAYIERRPKAELDALSKKLCSFDASLLAKIQSYRGMTRELLYTIFDGDGLSESLDKLEKLGLVVRNEKDGKYYSTLEPRQGEVLANEIIDREAAEEEEAAEPTKSLDEIDFADFDIPDATVTEEEQPARDTKNLFNNIDVIDGILNSLEETKKKKPNDGE